MTGNGKHTTFKNGDDWGLVYYCLTHIIFYRVRAIYIYIHMWKYIDIDMRVTYVRACLCACVCALISAPVLSKFPVPQVPLDFVRWMLMLLSHDC